MVLVDADAVEARLVGELQLVQELVVEPAGLLGVVEVVGRVDPDRAVTRLEVIGQESVRHEVEKQIFIAPPG